MYKLNTINKLLRFKAYLYIQEDLQNIIELDIYTAIGIYYLLRILLTLITVFNLKCHLVDITNMFLNTVLDEEVYIKYFLGFEVRGYI